MTDDIVTGFVAGFTFLCIIAGGLAIIYWATLEIKDTFFSGEQKLIQECVDEGRVPLYTKDGVLICVPRSVKSPQ